MVITIKQCRITGALYFYVWQGEVGCRLYTLEQLILFMMIGGPR